MALAYLVRREMVFGGKPLRKGDLISAQGLPLGMPARRLEKLLRLRYLEKAEGFPCPKCEFVAKSEGGLKKHLRSH